jgi:TalC/MipB family fructose-6-phosphate aldolase
MRLYLDSANADVVRRLSSWGAFSGVTTNPILLARARLGLVEAVQKLGEAQPGDLFVQVEGSTTDEMEQSLRSLAETLPTRLMFKVPPTGAGLALMSRLRDERIWTAATALFTFGQGLLAANAGADLLIPFYSRIGEEGGDPQALVEDLVEMCNRRGGRPRVLVASLKSIDQVHDVARGGAWAATVPPALAEALLESAGSARALSRFMEAGRSARE